MPDARPWVRVTVPIRITSGGVETILAVPVEARVELFIDEASLAVVSSGWVPNEPLQGHPTGPSFKLFETDVLPLLNDAEKERILGIIRKAVKEEFLGMIKVGVE